jgi:hypothetical protein
MKGNGACWNQDLANADKNYQSVSEYIEAFHKQQSTIQKL